MQSCSKRLVTKRSKTFSSSILTAFGWKCRCLWGCDDCWADLGSEDGVVLARISLIWRLQHEMPRLESPTSTPASNSVSSGGSLIDAHQPLSPTGLSILLLCLSAHLLIHLLMQKPPVRQAAQNALYTPWLSEQGRRAFQSFQSLQSPCFFRFLHWLCCYFSTMQNYATKMTKWASRIISLCQDLAKCCQDAILPRTNFGSGFGSE